MPPSNPSGIQRPQPRNLTTILFGAIFAVVLGIVVVGALFQMTESSTKKQAGRPLIVGRSDELAETVAERGPLLLPDLAGGTRAIFVNHLGGNRWVAFESNPPDSPRRCQLEWQPDAGTFLDACSGTTYPADGSGLLTFPTSIDEEGRLLVDLRAPVTPSTAPPVVTTGPPPTTRLS